MFPVWLHVLAWVTLTIGGLSAALIAYDTVQYTQSIAVMNVVWPTTELFGGPLTLWLYFGYGRLATRARMEVAMRRRKDPPGSKTHTPFATMVAKGASHCGSGCMIGDIVAEGVAFFVPSIAILFGWNTIFSDKMYAVLLLDSRFAFLLCIVFQYFAIMPMRKLSLCEGS